MKLTDKLDVLMKERDINKRELSKQSGIPYMTIVNFYELGTDNIKLSTLMKLKKYFNVTLDYLADDDVLERN
jgi:DNA-binding Xre family transcriptional regulator